MVLNLILAISIPLSLMIMGFFYYKTVLLFIKEERREEQMIKPPIEEEQHTQPILTPDILNEYLYGKEE